MFGRKPTISHMKPFGAICYVHIPEEKRPSGSKLDPRAEKAIFLGYTDTHKIYRMQLATGHIMNVPASECKFEPFIKPQRPQEPLESHPPELQELQVSYEALIAKAMVEILDPFIPQTYDEAVNSPSHLWLAAL